MIEFPRIGIAESAALSAFATAIVREHFDPLIGTAQNDYMLEKFQSEPAIRHQLESGYEYHWVLLDGIRAGFLAVLPRDGKLYLSKFYTEKSFRGRHLARAMHAYIVRRAAEQRLPAVFLNVNRGNSDVIAIYHHLGYIKVREEKNDIGSGFYMDDFVLEYTLTEEERHA